MSLPPVTIKVEKDAIQGSLGSLLCSYADSSDDDNEEGGGLSNQPNLKIKSEPVDDIPMKDEDEKKGSDFLDFAKIKEEAKEDVGRDEDMWELGVEDFLQESYVEARNVKVEVESGTDDTESDSEDSDKDSEESDDGSPEEKAKGGKKKPEGPKAKGEMGLYDLPPIEDLHISVPHDECKPIGVIKSVVEPLVIVEALPETPVLNLDSVLFLDEGDRALGHIFDVIGPVKGPLYCVRFNSKEHIEKNKVEVGMNVYCAPKTPYTSYVFLAQLKRLKGSDASWVNDIEPPREEVEYSDDEMERIAKKKKKNRRIRTIVSTGTEQDAMNNEGEQNAQKQNGHRVMKRHHNQQSQPPSGIPDGSPFIPPFVPGFIPPSYMHPNQFRPPGYYQNHNQRRPRGRRQHHHQRFHPPPSLPDPRLGAYPQGYYNQPMGPWCPPQFQNFQPNYNFNYYNPYRAPHPGMSQPPPPPPPPPAPPGE